MTFPNINRNLVTYGQFPAQNEKLYFVFQVKLLLIIAVAIDDMNATFTCILKTVTAGVASIIYLWIIRVRH